MSMYRWPLRMTTREDRRTRHVPNEVLTEAEKELILAENQKAADAAAIRYLESLKNGTAPKDPWGLENYGFALTPNKDGTMDVYLTNPNVIKFDESTGTVTIHGEVAKKLAESDYAKLEAGEPLVEVFSVTPKYVAEQVASITIVPAAMGQVPTGEQQPPQSVSPTAAAPAVDAVVMAR
jgi:hypothetical protein